MSKHCCPFPSNPELHEHVNADAELEHVAIAEQLLPAAQ
jgi:hypothetical protein